MNLKGNLRIRLTLTLVALLLLFVAVFSSMFFTTEKRHFTREFHDRQDRLSRELMMNYRQVNVFGGSEAVWRAMLSQDWPPDLVVAYIDASGINRPIRGRIDTPTHAQMDRLRQTAQPLKLGPGPGPDEGPTLIPVLGRKPDEVQGAIVMAHNLRGSDGPEYRNAESARSFFESGLVALLVCALATYLLTAALVRPLSRLDRATRAIAENDFSVRLPTMAPGELGNLCAQFNRMADQLEVTIGSLKGAKERAERSENSKKNFLAEASHNLRTPLAAMLGWTEALMDGLVAPDEQAVHLKRIHREVLYCSRMVHRLLDWSRWDTEGPRLKLEHMALSEPLMDCVDNLSELAETKHVELTFAGLEQEPMVLADRTRLRELLQILLENAVDHNPAGTRIEVSCTLVPTPAGRSRYQVAVCDNGPGLSEALTADLTARPNGRLGLAIGSHIAQAHGDGLRVLPGAGTRIGFTLLRAEASQALP